MDPDTILKTKIVEFVDRGDFGLASGQNLDGSYKRVWLEGLVSPDNVAFDAGVFLLRKDAAKALKVGPSPEPVPVPSPEPWYRISHPVSTARSPEPGSASGASTTTLHLVGTVPPEIWNRLGTKILPKLRAGVDLEIRLEFSVTVNSDTAQSLKSELRQALQDLGLAESVRIE